MSTMHTEERIGEAWRLHRAGDNAGAIEIFDDILRKTPKNIDAHYGLGLARRADGNAESAIESFKQALELSHNALDAVETTSASEGHHGANDLDTYEDDRYLMLIHMIGQRLAELGVEN